MSRRRKRHGDGTVWLVAHRPEGDYLCYWYVGTGDGHLAESARVANAPAAVAWGRLRTPRVRLSTGDGCSQWAGTADRPAGFTTTWMGSDTTVAARPSGIVDIGPPKPDRAGEAANTISSRTGVLTGGSQC